MKKLFVLLVIALSAIGASGQGVQEWYLLLVDYQCYTL